MPLFISVNDAIDLPLLGNDDVLKRGKGRMLKWAKYVFADMNMSSLKVATRELFEINKRTNSVDLPSNSYKVCSVEIMDRNGVKYPVWRNDRLSDDIIEISAAKDCACEFKCGNTLCNTIKGYVAVTSTKSDTLPNGNPISFTCVDRQSVDDNGFFYSETQYPLRVYTNGVWTGTVLHTEQKKMCKVEVDANGCVCDTQNNINSLCNACGANINNLGQAPANLIPVGGNAQSFCGNPAVNTWIYYCSDKMDWFSTQCGHMPRNCNNIYNISELGDRLIFPSDFGFSKVLVRYYADIELKNMKIPFIAIDTFVAGLKWWDVRWNDDKQKLSIQYEANYTKLKWGLQSELNKHTIEEQRMILTPPVHIPSFHISRRH